VPRYGHGPGNVRTLRRWGSRVAYALRFRTSGVRCQFWMDTHAQNGLLRRIFCTLGMGTNLSRTTYSNFGTLSYLLGANRLHS
jgi:hypothetical protein